MTPSDALPNPMKHVAISYLAASAPLLAGYLHVQDAVKVLKIALTWHTTQAEDLSVDEAAHKLERSERWMYKYKSMLKKFGLLKNELALHTEIRDFFFVHRQDRGGTVQECLSHLKRRGFSKKRLLLENLLETYCREGYLARDGEVYRWKGTPQHINASAVLGRGARAAGLTGVFGTLLKRYVEADDGYVRHVHVTIARDEYEAMVKEIKAFVDKSVKKAVLRSLENDPENRHPDSVTMDSLLLFGSTPYHPEGKE